MENTYQRQPSGNVLPVHGAGECAETVAYVSVVESVYVFAPGQDAGATVAS
jgi:hypothetical protein